jgi:hypothetical protein
MPKNYQAGAIIISNSGRGVALILGALFFLEISKRQFWLFFFNLVVIALTIAMIIEYMPESPKYLYILKRYRKAREILVGIGQKYNRVTIRAVFREEARD